MENFKFYNSYLKLIDEDYKYRQQLSILGKKLKHSKFRKFIIETIGMNFMSIIKLSDAMRSLMIRPQRLLTDNENFYIACDMMTNTYYICYKELMMIDIDFYKDDTKGNTKKDTDATDTINSTNSTDTTKDIGLTKDDEVDTINATDTTKDTGLTKDDEVDKIKQLFIEDIKEHPNNCWSLYRTRGGVHAFLLSEKMCYNSQSSCEIMLKFRCDFNYIIYSHLRGWSVRLNRKQKETEITNEFLCNIGENKYILKDLSKQLDLHNKLIEVFKNESPSLMYGE